MTHLHEKYLKEMEKVNNNLMEAVRDSLPNDSLLPLLYWSFGQVTWIARIRSRFDITANLVGENYL